MKRTICIILMVLFTGLLATSGYFIAQNRKAADEAGSMYDELADMVDKATTPAVDENGETAPPAEEASYSADKTFLVDYSELYAQNSDMVGWIKIEDTNINYPVVQSVDSPDFYLKHGFDKSYSDYGCPYVQENCDVQFPSDNIVIYGHHMKNGSMFADLEKFKTEEFWQSHKTFTFDTLTDHHVYEIVAVFKTVVYTDSPESFKYYRFVDATSESDFDEFIAKCKDLSLYDTGVDAEYGDKLVTLSTCEYSRTNGRLVVVGKLIAEP